MRLSGRQWLWLLLLSAAPLAAQSLTGSITGTVRDEQGGVLPGATVSLTGKTGTRVATSDANGAYRFTAVEPGDYTLSTELSGFTGPKAQAVSINVGNQITLDLTMKVGGLAENVTVVGDHAVVDVKSSADRDHDLAVAPVQRADHAHRDQRASTTRRA